VLVTDTPLPLSNARSSSLIKSRSNFKLSAFVPRNETKLMSLACRFFWCRRQCSASAVQISETVFIYLFIKQRNNGPECH